MRANPFETSEGTQFIMTRRKAHITGGVDTHKDTHHAAALDAAGRVLQDQSFPATADGYCRLLTWLRSFGRLGQVGVEGTGSYGAGLARYLTRQNVEVIEVDRPDRKTRRSKGKSDPIDAIAAAQAVLSGRAAGIPKTRTGPVEAIRVLRVARASAVKSRTAALNQLHGLVTTAPEPLRERLRKVRGARLLHACNQLTVDDAELADPAAATIVAIQILADRIRYLTDEITLADQRMTALVPQIAPHTMALVGVGPDSAAQLMITAGDNPERLRSEAAFAHLTAAAPLPASSGRTDRHRLNRGGDRAANKALYTIVLTRLRHDQRTRDYVQRRTKEGLTKKEIMRCLKRYVVREIHSTLLADFASLPA
ncbi:IS110 family transposase [Catellatospora sp. NPDC049609]|uniref:IS110 family transposase n=1 Tax=Catellatospora sp. NPDC049609 TaxID=3155505 RepID=UPI003442B843